MTSSSRPRWYSHGLNRLAYYRLAAACAAGVPRREEPSAQLPIAQMRGEQDDAAPGRAGCVQVLLALGLRHVVAEPRRIPAIDGQQVGEAGREVGEGLAHRPIQGRRGGVGEHAG